MAGETHEIAVSERQVAKTLARMRRFLDAQFPQAPEHQEWPAFLLRLDEHFPALMRHLFALYGHHYDFYYHLERLVELMARAWLGRRPELKSLDAMRLADPGWYQSGHLTAAMAYVDQFAGGFSSLRQRIPYLCELGISYLHLMPIYQVPEVENDGGYAVSDYRTLDPKLGTMEEFLALADELRRHGISLVLDFVFNHSSDQHAWALAAKAGDENCRDYYLMFDTREEPEEYERHLREIFPTEHAGCFSWNKELRKWVWTTFKTFQWDLNYRNPELFHAMAGELLFLANLGVEVLRLDAVPFIWKQKGTNCENLPEAHTVIRAYHEVARIVTPAMVFKSEAIVAPEFIQSYIGPDQCQISYNPLLMALLWESLATRSAKLLAHSMKKHFAIDPSCSWLNYVRSHDDIGWGFDDRDAWEVGIDPRGHRHFLNQFYQGKHPASFAEGLVFQEDPKTGDARICGTSASLCGLGRALASGDAQDMERAFHRLFLIHGITHTIGGIPLLYLGEEIGMLNDDSFRDAVAHADDSRWVHRGRFDWDKAEKRRERGTPEERIFHFFLSLRRIRQMNPALMRGSTRFLESGNEHVFAYARECEDQIIYCLANFSEHEQEVAAAQLRKFGLSKQLIDILSGEIIALSTTLAVGPLQLKVLLDA